jgi:serine protease AprX
VALHPDIQTLTAAVDFVNPPVPIQGQDGALLDAGLESPLTSPLNSVDPNGHGTHVAGILVGNGSHSPEGRLAGIAPQANLVSVRVLDDVGSGTTSGVLAGLQWILAHKDEYGIRVVNVSLGHPVYEPLEVDPLVQAVDALWDSGVVVVCSAGNAGRDGYVTITSPCNSRKVITVGATNDHQTPEITDDTITTYTSRGPTALDLVAKPDLVAPGNRIVSARAAGSYLDSLFPDRRVAADPNQPDVAEYFEMSGTSMSAPIVAGTAALMLEQDPSLNPGTVKARLMMSARKPVVGDPLVTGAGMLDILGALQATGYVADAPSPKTIPDPCTGLIGFENTAVLWGNEAFSLMALWSSAVIWTDPTAAYEAILWSAGELWPASEVWPETELWPEEMSEVWPENELWPDTEAWIPQLTSPAESEPVAIEPLAVGYQDP